MNRAIAVAEIQPAAIPHRQISETAVGKFDKKVLRARLADGDLEVERIG
jgi:hypothetical protein